MRRLVSARTLIVLIVGTGLATAASADTITVCWDGSGDYLTIQEGIDATVDGDEVVVCDGTYTGPGNKNLDFGGKAITVRSENGPDTCIIDCEGSGRGFHFHTGETNASMLDGFTITNGVTSNGGGVYCNQSSPTITNCILWGDAPDEVYIYAGIVSITYCDIEGGWLGDGNIDADPLFAEPGFIDDNGTPEDPFDDLWIDGDYYSLPGSPCIDAGDNTAVPPDTLDLDGDGDTTEPIPIDLDGRLRFADRIGTPDTGNPGVPGPPIADMGAYEYQCDGDLDGDGDIDLSDLAQLLSNYGTTGACYADGDIDLDGDVDLSDLAALLAVYGTTCP